MNAAPHPGNTPSGTMPAPLSRPSHEVTPLYGEEFAADPYAVYERLRRYGALAPVEIAPGVGAMLVIDYRAALDLLHDPVTWSKDSSVWQDTVPQDSPVLPMLRARPNALFSDGEAHARYRQVISDGFARLEPHQVRQIVREVSDQLIARFAQDGEVDLISKFARLLPLLFFNRAFGLADDRSELLIQGIAGMFDSKTTEEAEAADVAYTRYITELTQAKQRERGQDLTSWFMDHPAGLSAEEVIHQIVLTMGASYEPLSNLIGNALGRMLVDERYYSNLSGGALTPRDALHDVLRNEPPMANYSAHFPKRDVYFHGVWLRAGQLVLVSYAAATTQSGRAAPGEATGADGSGGGAHLAWAAGPHGCPAQQPALLIASTAIERLTAWLSDIRLTVTYDELKWRPGPFQRGLVALPARFSPVSPDHVGGTPWKSPSI
ncbi:cytochrome P450 [Streptomyces reniochalinae]|nr:cytochrome P450 [Streptomyces reniochalinae]